MAETSFYVYALKDTRTSPARPFYIGKGTGTRSHDHLLKLDSSRKGQRIAAILAAGHKVLVARIIEDLSEEQAIKLEAELISAFGTEDTGGLLTNQVVPSGVVHKSRRSVVRTARRQGKGAARARLTEVGGPGDGARERKGNHEL